MRAEEGLACVSFTVSKILYKKELNIESVIMTKWYLFL